MSAGTTTADAPRVQFVPMSVAALLERANDGDQSAWDDLVEQFAGLVWSVARGYRLGSSTDDVVQVVWLRLAENLDRIRNPDSLASWLATTTRNEALRVSRRERRSVPLAELPERHDATVSTLDELVTDDDTLSQVLEAFRQLPEKDQELLRLLCTVPPLDYATIADLLGRSIGSIGPSRDRSLKKLRKLLPRGLDDRRSPARKDPAE